jgi:archaellum biogenesis protein FlaJ (TadC family)
LRAVALVRAASAANDGRSISSKKLYDMSLVSKLLGFICLLLTIVLWAVTLTTDPTPHSIAAAGTLTVIIGLIAVFSWVG